MDSLKDEIIRELDHLTAEQQQRLLDFSRQMQSDQMRHISVLPPGTPGEVLLKYMDQFQFEPGEVDSMFQMIHDNC